MSRIQCLFHFKETKWLSHYTTGDGLHDGRNGAIFDSWYLQWI